RSKPSQEAAPRVAFRSHYYCFQSSFGFSISKCPREIARTLRGRTAEARVAENRRRGCDFGCAGGNARVSCGGGERARAVGEGCVGRVNFCEGWGSFSERAGSFVHGAEASCSG